MSITVRFTEIEDNVARELLDFATRKNIGQAITVDGVEYVLDGISQGSSAFWRSRGLSIYYRAGRSVVRISDHWSQSNHHERSRKFNCGRIGGHQAHWIIDNSAPARLTFDRYAGKYPWTMLAGKSGLVQLNKSVPHWAAA
jgi:hypothetical protein